MFVVMVFSRFLFGSFLALLGGMVLYMVMMAALLSFYPLGPNLAQVSTIVGGGFGAGIGAFCGWLTIGEGKRNLVILVLALVGGFVGGQLGLLRGVDVEHMPGMPGSPQFASLIWGTVIGANVVPLCHFIFRRLRGERLV